MKQLTETCSHLHELLALISVSEDGVPHGECNKDKSRLKIAAASNKI